MLIPRLRSLLFDLLWWFDSILLHYANNSWVISTNCLSWPAWWRLVVHWTCLYVLFHDFAHCPLRDIKLLSDVLLGVRLLVVSSRVTWNHSDVTSWWSMVCIGFVVFCFRLQFVINKKKIHLFLNHCNIVAGNFICLFCFVLFEPVFWQVRIKYNSNTTSSSLLVTRWDTPCVVDRLFWGVIRIAKKWPYVQK